MKSVRKRLSFALTACGCIGLIGMSSGCGAPKEAVLAHVDGTVKINGRPAPNILIQFLPIVAKGDPGPTASGISNELGEFEMASRAPSSENARCCSSTWPKNAFRKECSHLHHESHPAWPLLVRTVWKSK
jgi:hypothetical protein